MFDTIKRYFGCKGTYKWAMKQAKNYVLVSRKKNGFRIFNDHMACLVIVYRKGRVTHEDMWKHLGLRKEVAECYKPSKEDIKAKDWVIDDSRFNK